MDRVIGSLHHTLMAEQVETQLINMVTAGQLEAGVRLNEVELAGALGVSRGPLREAIRRLSGQGYLTMKAHKGAYVRVFSPKDIRDLYELRMALELFALRLVFKRARDGDYAVLEEEIGSTEAPIAELQGAEEVVPRSSGPYVAELGFHEHLASLCGNDQIIQQLEEANQKLYIALAPTRRSGGRQRHSSEQHRNVLARLKDGDLHGALTQLEYHLMDSMRNSLKVLGLEESETTNSERTESHDGV